MQKNSGQRVEERQMSCLHIFYANTKKKPHNKYLMLTYLHVARCDPTLNERFCLKTLLTNQV